MRVCAVRTEFFRCDGLVCPKQRRSATDHDSGSARGARGGAFDLRRRYTDGTQDRGSGVVHRQDGRGFAGPVWIACASARQHRIVRNHGVLGEWTQTRDWSAHGIGRDAEKRAVADPETGHVAGGGRRDVWLGGGLGCRAAAGENAGRQQREGADQGRGRGMSLVVAGVMSGLVAALVVGRLLARMLYGISASDPISVAGAACVLLAVALVACYLPARSASRRDPLVALREG